MNMVPVMRLVRDHLAATEQEGKIFIPLIVGKNHKPETKAVCLQSKSCNF